MGELRVLRVPHFHIILPYFGDFNKLRDIFRVTRAAAGITKVLLINIIFIVEYSLY
jgi:hypothetical protein